MNEFADFKTIMESLERNQNKETVNGKSFGSLKEFIRAAEEIKARSAGIRIYGKRLEKVPPKKVEAGDRYVLVDDPSASIETSWMFFRRSENTLRANVFDGKPLKFPFRLNDKNISSFRFDIF